MHHEVRSLKRAAHGSAVGRVRAAELRAGLDDARGGRRIDVDPDHVVALGGEPAGTSRRR